MGYLDAFREDFIATAIQWAAEPAEDSSKARKPKQQVASENEVDCSKARKRNNSSGGGNSVEKVESPTQTSAKTKGKKKRGEKGESLSPKQDKPEARPEVAIPYDFEKGDPPLDDPPWHQGAASKPQDCSASLAQDPKDLKHSDLKHSDLKHSPLGPDAGRLIYQGTI